MATLIKILVIKSSGILLSILHNIVNLSFKVPLNRSGKRGWVIRTCQGYMDGLLDIHDTVVSYNSHG